MASQLPPSLLPVIGPDGIARENPLIAYTEKLIEDEHIQLKRYIQENYSKIHDVERELENLTLELKLTAGPKKAALEHLRKKIELQSERIHVAKLKEDQAKKVWEAASQAVWDEEETKKKICDDLNQLVQESTATQLTRLEELKRRLAALNPSRSSFVVYDGKSVQQTDINVTASQPAQLQLSESSGDVPENTLTGGNNSGRSASDGRSQRSVEVREKKRIPNLGSGKGSMVLPKGRGPSGPGWTGAGFDVGNGT
ncbi:uncharacterized protein LOC103697091 [Phoenix dactylifera]|uniref:Uncharacterized protein LOC103697091 n=1 Tax=Phoenix dactylifera TaxID=42345 RepID=A0A8B9A632_PHODC|nr:uncharacterized protein LOC103697091 [Phoenix dactylifera]XP_038979318.1 uncharacterized protein LOC103697091 [Phoenix dactylifera]